MDYAMQYVKREESENGEIEAINQTQMCKQMIIPCELFGFIGDKITKEA